MSGSSPYAPVTQQPARLADRVAVVTGAAHGIGLAIADRLAAEGAHVVVSDVDEDAANDAVADLRNRGLAATAVTSDVRLPASLEALAAEAVSISGQIDILVNNAAVFSTIRMTRAPFDEIPIDEWDDLMAVNLKGTWLACRAIVPAMKQQGHGKIVNIGSASAYKGAVHRIHYVASKAGMIGFTRSLARELGPDGILVNCVAPGSTLSELAPDAEILDRRSAAIASRAIGRIERPEDIVGAVAFFAGPDSDFITGQTLIVDGGSHMQ